MRFKYSIRDLGEGILEKIGSQSENIINLKNWLQEYDFFPEYPDDPYAWLTDVLALKSVNSGNYGVGSILVSAGGEIAAMDHNLVYLSENINKKYKQNYIALLLIFLFWPYFYFNINP